MDVQVCGFSMITRRENLHMIVVIKDNENVMHIHHDSLRHSFLDIKIVSNIMKIGNHRL